MLNLSKKQNNVAITDDSVSKVIKLYSAFKKKKNLHIPLTKLEFVGQTAWRYKLFQKCIYLYGLM